MKFKQLLSSVLIFAVFSVFGPLCAALWGSNYGANRPPTGILYFILSIWPGSWLGGESPGWGRWPYTIGANILLFCFVGGILALVSARHRWLIWLIYSGLLIALLYPLAIQPVIQHITLVLHSPALLMQLHWLMILSVALALAAPFYAVTRIAKKGE